MKKILAAIVLAAIGITNLGCNKSKKEYVTSTAPVSTVTVVFVDEFDEQDRLELIQEITKLFELVLKDETNPTNYTVNVTNTEVNVTAKGNSVLVWCGKNNECPDLPDTFYDMRYRKHKKKDK